VKKFRCGFVAVIGRPNVGKSTFLNSVLKEKVSIVSDIPQTTRHNIRAVLTKSSAQVVFIDTPGMHLFKDKLVSALNSLAVSSLKDIDAVVYIVDCSRGPFQEEERIVKILSRQRAPIIMALNKIDKSRKYLSDYINLWENSSKTNTGPLKYFIPISALRGTNLDKLVGSIEEFLPQGEPFYPAEVKTDFPLSYRVSDVIREKICCFLKEEVPHGTAVETISIEDNDKLAIIRANILISHKSQKLIAVGRKGEMIKRIGISARMDLERIFKKKVFLDLKVKLEKGWQNKPRILQALGYTRR